MSDDRGAISTRATLDDLMRTEGKAELIGGEVVKLMAAGRLEGRVALRIASRLVTHARATGVGEAFADGLGYAVPELASGRESFETDASYYVGPPAVVGEEQDFIPGPPTFAVEVRSKGDRGPASERAMADKRADDFEAGTLVVWDVDPVARVVRSYRRDTADVPATFAPGDLADAEPAVPGWRADPAEFFA